MKKNNLFVLLAMLCSVSLFTACSDDDDDDSGEEYKELNGTYAPNATGENPVLTVTYSGTAMSGGTVVFAATGSNNGTLNLAYLVPGEASAEVSVALTPVAGTSGKYSFAGTDTKDNRTVKAEGTIEKGSMSLDLTVTMPSSNLVETWKPLQLTETATPIHFVWESSATVTIPALSPEPMPTAVLAQALSMNPDFAGLLSTVLQSITFEGDGNVVAAYTKIATGAQEVSPLNLAHYYVKDSKLYALLSLDAIMGLVNARSTELSGLALYLRDGFPLSYAVNGSNLTLYLDQALVASLLSDPTTMELLTGLIGGLDAETQTMVQAILTEVGAAMSKTTKLEIGLNMTK